MNVKMMKMILQNQKNINITKDSETENCEGQKKIKF